MLEEFIRDLEDFNHRYRQVYPSHAELWSTDPKVEARRNEKLRQTGQLIIDLYEDVKQYHPYMDRTELRNAWTEVYNAALHAKDILQRKNYEELSIILYPKGSTIDDPSTIEKAEADLKRLI